MGPGVRSGLRLDFAACLLLRMNCSLLPTQLLGQQAAGVGGQRGLESAAMAKSGISSVARHAKQRPEDHTAIPYIETDAVFCGRVSCRAAHLVPETKLLSVCSTFQFSSSKGKDDACQDTL